MNKIISLNNAIYSNVTLFRQLRSIEIIFVIVFRLFFILILSICKFSSFWRGFVLLIIICITLQILYLFFFFLHFTLILLFLDFSTNRFTFLFSWFSWLSFLILSLFLLITIFFTFDNRFRLEFRFLLFALI